MASFAGAPLDAAPAARESIPGLCYHQILPKATGLFELSTEDFRKQLSLLKVRGYQSLNSQQLLDILTGKTQPIGKSVVITFDDGYKSVYEHAFPIMREYGFTGIACVYPEFLNSSGGMSWNQLQELINASWSVEPHSYSHSDLSKIPGSAAAREAFFQKEILGPKHTIESKLGNRVLFMVWPYGIYTEETEAFAREHGFAGAMTVDGGASYPGLDTFRVKRQVVYRTDTLEKFSIRVEMAALEIRNPSPRPGETVQTFQTMSCEIPIMKGENPENYVINAKVTGGSLKFIYDQESTQIKAQLSGKIKTGPHFIDVYLRDKRTGVTHQNGWLFSVAR
jgi:peptidoglycan/xylan/chitin deacetylase (PgdA/CDA1 family)